MADSSSFTANVISDAPGQSGSTNVSVVQSNVTESTTVTANVISGGASGGGAVDSVNAKTGVVVLNKTDIGLSNVDNTSDANKPISTATQSALNSKYDASNPSGYVTSSQAATAAPVQSVAGKTGTVTLAKGDVGLANVDNTSDANKPISSATQTALNGKEPTITAGTTSQYWRGDKTWQTYDKASVGLGNVDNTSDANKPVSTAQQTALNGKENSFSKGSIIAGTNVTISGTLTNRLVGTGDITINAAGGGGGGTGDVTQTANSGGAGRMKVSSGANKTIQDYATAGIVKSDANGVVSAATQGSDYYAPGGTDIAIVDGGTGASTQQAAINALTGTQTAGRYLRSDGTNSTLSSIVAADVPTLNQNTTGSAATLTTGRTISVSGDLSYTSPAFDGSGNVTAAGTLATVNSNTGSYGSATQVAAFTVNAKGLTTAASNVSIQIAESQVTNLVSDLAAKKSTITQQPTQTSNFTAAAGSFYPVNASTANVTVTLPTSTAGQEIQIKKLDANAATGATSGIVFLSGTINGVSSTTVPLRKLNQGKQLLADGSGGWSIALGDLDITSLYATAAEPGTIQLAGDLTNTPQSPALTTTGVTAGSYTNTNLTVDAKGRITAASNGAGGGGSGITRNVSNPTTSSTLGTTANTDYVVNTTVGQTLPAANANTNSYKIRNISSGQITISRTGSDTIAEATTFTIESFDSWEFISNGTNNWSTF